MYNTELFVGGKLPRVFTKKENLEYFEKYNKGDMNARDELILHNLKLVIYQVFNKFGTFSYDKDELISVGIVGLIKAIDTFDTSRLREFSTYASICINNEILMFIRKEKKHARTVRLEDYAYSEDLKIGDFVYDDYDFICDYEEKETILEIKKLISTLPEDDKKLYDLYFNKKLIQKDIASIFNLTQGQISRRKNKLLSYLEEKMYEEQIIEKKTSVKRKKYTINNK